MLETREILWENAEEKQFCEETERDEQAYFCKVNIIKKIKE